MFAAHYRPSLLPQLTEFLSTVNAVKPKTRGIFYVGVKSKVYSCYEKGCPTKPYATMPKGIMGNEVHGP